MSRRSVELVAADAFGDFEDGVRAHLPVMHRLAARLAPNAVDDVLQEALLRAWRKWGSYRPDRGSLRVWLLTITANEARRHGQTQQRALRLLQRLTAEHRPAPPERDDPVPDALSVALERLSPRQRAVVDLHYFVDLPVEEVAVVLGISVGTVKSTLSDARHRLRALISTGA